MVKKTQKNKIKIDQKSKKIAKKSAIKISKVKKVKSKIPVKKVMLNKKIVQKVKSDIEPVIEKSFHVNSIDNIKKIKIRVIGVGGGGGSIVSEIAQKVKKASFIVANTDSQALKMVSRKATRFSFGQALTRGLGTGMDYELAAQAAENEKEKIKKLLIGQDLCIFVACLGGGTGSGAMPTFARIAKNLGVITYGIFTVPFKFEGERKIQTAIEALDKLKPSLNAMSIIPNDRIFYIIDKNTPLKNALSSMNKVLGDGLEALLNTVYSPGLINIDFADLKTVFDGRGRLTYLSSVEISEIEKNTDLVKNVLNSPLYPYSIRGARGIIMNIVGSKNLGLKEISQISKTISGAANKDAKIILGISQKQIKDDKIRITLLATGCGQRLFSDSKPKEQKKKPLEQPKENSKENQIKPIKKVKQKRKLKIKSKTKPKQKQEAPISYANDIPNTRPVQKENDEYIRRNALEVKKEIEETEKETIEQDKKWEIPSFLRRNR